VLNELGEVTVSYHDLRFDEGEGLDREGLAERVVNGEVFVFCSTSILWICGCRPALRVSPKV